MGKYGRVTLPIRILFFFFEERRRIHDKTAIFLNVQLAPFFIYDKRLCFEGR